MTEYDRPYESTDIKSPDILYFCVTSIFGCKVGDCWFSNALANTEVTMFTMNISGCVIWVRLTDEIGRERTRFAVQWE